MQTIEEWLRKQMVACSKTGAFITSVTEDGVVLLVLSNSLSQISSWTVSGDALHEDNS
jgi:hypothetical protein